MLGSNIAELPHGAVRPIATQKKEFSATSLAARGESRRKPTYQERDARVIPKEGRQGPHRPD